MVSDDDPDSEPVGDSFCEEPSWLKKMMGKLKKSFCLKLDLQDRMYEEHVNAKKDRQRQKHLLRHFKLPVSDGSEYSITSEEKWISKQHGLRLKMMRALSTIPGVGRTSSHGACSLALVPFLVFRCQRGRRKY